MTDPTEEGPALPVEPEPDDKANVGDALGDSVQIESLWRALENTRDFIKVADAKAGAVLVASGTAVAILSQHGVRETMPLMIALLWGLDIFVLVAAVVCAALTISPRRRVQPTDVWPSGTNLIYFQGVAHQSCRSYVEQVVAATAWRDGPHGITEHIAGQTWALSVVCDRKFRWCSRAVWLLTGGVSLGAITACLDWWLS